jgi:aquaporin Z
LTRRILFGKDDQEEKTEEKNQKRLNWFKKELRRHMAEFVGTFFIVFFVAGIQVNQDFNSRGGANSGVSNIDKGIVSGFLLIGLIYSFGKISGAHFNPCVTLAFTLRGAFNFFRCITYVIVQFAGACTGAGVLYGLFGNVNGLGNTLPESDLPAGNAFGIEILISFLLLSVILSTAENAQILGPTSGLAVGLTFGSLELWAWNWTGASANPWRTIGPTLISNKGWGTYWIYIIGPIIGTLLAVLLQRLLVSGVKQADRKKSSKGSGKLGGKKD